jgi:hypothetical protein
MMRLLYINEPFVEIRELGRIKIKIELEKNHEN